MQKIKKSTGDFIIFWKNKTKTNKKTNQLERKKEKKGENKNRLENKPDQFEIKGEGQRKLMVSSNNPNSDHQKWSHL